MRTARLGDLVSVHGGGTPRRSTPEYYGGAVPWVTPKDMKRWAISDSSVRLTAAGVENSPAKVIEPGSVLVVVRSGVLKHTLPVALNGASVTVNQDMKALTPHSEVYAPYLARFIKHMQPTVLGWVRATTADNFPIGKLLALKVPVPPLEEQQRIAAILDLADDISAKHRRALAHIDDLTQSIFDDMFGFNEWDSTLAELADVQIGPFGSLLHQEDYVSGGVAVINPMHIRDDQLRPDREFSVSEAKAGSLSSYRLRCGDLVLGRRGEMGRAGVASGEHEGMLCGTGSLILRPREVNSQFLHAVITSPRMKAYLERNALGATLPNLNSGIVKASPAPRAHADLQALFASKLTAVFRAEAVAQKGLESADELFASLQFRAFAGEL